MKLCFVVFVLLTFISLQLCLGQSDSVEAWRKRYPEWTQTAQFLYSFYRWPELKPLKRTPEMDTICAELTRNYGDSRSSLSGEPKFYEATRYRSQYFRCTFLLAYFISEDVMLGAGPPLTSMFALRDSSTQWHSFDDFKPGLQVKWPMEFRRNVQFLKTVGNFDALDSSTAIDAAVDLATVLSVETPVMVLDSVWDIYCFSNAISDTSFWEQLSDSTLEVLTSLRLPRAASSPIFNGSNWNRVEDDKAYEFYYEYQLGSSLSPVAAKEQTGAWAVHLYTWSPCNGDVFLWLIVIGGEDGLYVERASVYRGVGYNFTYY